MLLVATIEAADPQFSSDKPILNFRLPTFTPEGNRSWLVRGSEASFSGPDEIAVRELTLTIFSGHEDGRIETLMLSPAAQVLPARLVVTGRESIRVINDRFEATGTGWSYDHKEKKVSIARNVRVTFSAEFKEILK